MPLLEFSKPSEKSNVSVNPPTKGVQCLARKN